MAKIKKGDEVIVTTGKDKGRRGIVLQVNPSKQMLTVEGVGIAKKHTKPDPNKGEEGGIVDKTMPIHISNVKLYDVASNKGSRVGYRILEDNKKVRYFKGSNEVVDI